MALSQSSVISVSAVSQDIWCENRIVLGIKDYSPEEIRTINCTHVFQCLWTKEAE